MQISQLAMVLSMVRVNPGTVVAIRCWWGEHWGIVATDLYGQHTIISNRGARNGVTEEPWHDVVGDATWRIVNDLPSDAPAYFVIQRARSQIGTPYNFFKWNCQDLVYWALGLPPRSPQREAALGLATAACLGFIVFTRAKSG